MNTYANAEPSLNIKTRLYDREEIPSEDNPYEPLIRDIRIIGSIYEGVETRDGMPKRLKCN